jgi:hypothetical protein
VQSIFCGYASTEAHCLNFKSQTQSVPKQSKVAPGVSKFLQSKTLSSFMVALFELYFASVKTKQMVNVRLNMIQYTRTYMRIRTDWRAQKTKTKGDIFLL